MTKSTFEKKKQTIYGKHNVLGLGQKPEVLCLNTILFSDYLKGFRCPGGWHFFHCEKAHPWACEVKTICAFYQKTWQYMDAYESWWIVSYSFFLNLYDSQLTFVNFRKGLNAQQLEAEYVVKKYKSHCKVGTRIMMDILILKNEAYFTNYRL